MIDFSFYCFASCAVIGAFLLAFLPKLVQSAFSLVLTLFGVAGLYWTLGADFLGAVQLLVYVGGIMILILYGIMLTPKEQTRWTLTRLLIPGLLCAAPVAVLVHLAYKGLVAATGLGSTADLPPPTATTKAFGTMFLEREQYLIPFELASVVLLIALVGSVYLARRRREA